MSMKMGIRHHAVLYALIVKYIFKYILTDPEKTIEDLTHTYGLKRGRRMKELSIENNEPLNIDAFLVHGEWAGEKDENLSLLSHDDDNTYSTVGKCAWYDYWKKYDLLEYGTYYCHYIDKAICEGYEGDFGLKLEKAIGFGDEKCQFVWNRSFNEEYLKSHPKKWTLPFDFHCRELYTTAYEILDESIRDKILKDVNDEFCRIFKINLSE